MPMPKRPELTPAQQQAAYNALMRDLLLRAAQRIADRKQADPPKPVPPE